MYEQKFKPGFEVSPGASPYSLHKNGMITPKLSRGRLNPDSEAQNHGLHSIALYTYCHNHEEPVPPKSKLKPIVEAYLGSGYDVFDQYADGVSVKKRIFDLTLYMSTLHVW